MTEDSDKASSPRKPRSKTNGDRGELIAYEHLAGLGYAILEQNWRCGRLEIDIIAQKGTRIVFVEVKTRAGEACDPVMAVDKAKMQRTIRAADSYLKMHNLPFEYQFDIISIINPDNPRIEHIEDAFFPSPR